MAIKIVAKQRAYFNGEIIKPGQIITFKGDNIPSWAKKVGSGKTEEAKTPPTQPVENASEQQILLQPDTTTQIDNTANEQTAGELDLSGKTDDELNALLDDLITKGLDAGVYLESSENKTVIEQIQELTAEIKKKTTENKGE